MRAMILAFACAISFAFISSSCINAQAKQDKTEQAYTEYIVVSGTDLIQFQAAVKSKLVSGYKLIGGVSVASTMAYQAMAK